MAKITTSYQYRIGYYCKDGCFTIISKNVSNTWFDSWDEANEHCKQLQPQYKHKLEPYREQIKHRH